MDTEVDLRQVPRVSFNTLPAELRQQIWDLTFTPRVLCVHIHRRLAPPTVGRNGERLDCLLRTVAVSFTCTEFTPPSSTNRNRNLTTESIFASFAQRVAWKYETENLDSRMGSLTCGPSALGPVALYVCQESREIALQRYELAFGGVDVDLDGSQKQYWENRRQEDKAEWDRLCLFHKRIWVDFMKDIIFVDGHHRTELYSKCSRREPLTLLRMYAPEEASKIKRLAIGAVRGNGEPRYRDEVLKVIEGNRVYGEEGYEWIPAPGEVRSEYLYGFDNVEELLLDESVGTNGIKRMLRWDEKATKFNILESLRKEREKGPYKGELKRLEFVTGEDWNEYLYS